MTPAEPIERRKEGRHAGKALKAYPDAQFAVDATGRIGSEVVASWTHERPDGSEPFRVGRYAMLTAETNIGPFTW